MNNFCHFSTFRGFLLLCSYRRIDSWPYLFFFSHALDVCECVYFVIWFFVLAFGKLRNAHPLPSVKADINSDHFKECSKIESFEMRNSSSHLCYSPLHFSIILSRFFFGFFWIFFFLLLKFWFYLHIFYPHANHIFT